MLGNLGQGQGLGRADHALTVKGEHGKRDWLTASGNDDRLSLHRLLRAVVSGDLDGVGITQAGVSLQARNPVLLEQADDTLGEAFHHSVFAAHHRRQIQPESVTHDAMMREFATRLGKPFAGIEQGFAGDTADVETGAAEGRRLLYTGYSQTELRGANRPHIAARTCADHQNIEALCLSHSSIRNMAVSLGSSV